VKVFNDGPSFEMENPMEFFDPYKKDKEGKFGLGLAIVKKVIEAHEGTITAYNTQKGVEFKISFLVL
jgi:two-component system sensor histidine kinase CssS